jgi:Zn-dependent peptidase ImmA (M78 family)
MSAFGWIEKPRDWKERIDTTFKFFDVSDLAGWRNKYLSLVEGARFRASGAAPIVQPSVAAWLRQAEIQALEQDCAAWDPQAFETALTDIRPLTRQKDPTKFLPRLLELSAGAGVAVSVVRAPRGCPVSGAARFLKGERASVALSARHLTDDHFWFTYFHEAAHLLLHDANTLYVDELDREPSPSIRADEREADRFAGNVLIPPMTRALFPRHQPDDRTLLKLARSAGVAPGILVGQLQHEGVIGFATGLNHFKRRYRWNGVNLEMA